MTTFNKIVDCVIGIESGTFLMGNLFAIIASRKVTFNLNDAYYFFFNQVKDAYYWGQNTSVVILLSLQNKLM
jgi:hypothetical protein